MASSDLTERIADARRQLKRIEGVIGVGYGYKEERGETTTKLALRVYVREKKPKEELAPQDLVPSELNGLRTDVVLPIQTRPVQCEDDTHHSIQIGGIAISNLRQHLADPDNVAPWVGSGTLGCICTLSDVGGRDDVGFLTAHHVLGDGGGANRSPIYQPAFAGERRQPPQRYPVGHVHNIGHRGTHHYTYAGETLGLDYYIDCASAKLNTKFSSYCDTNCGVKFDTRIRSLADAALATDDDADKVAGFQRLGPNDIVAGQPYLLYKVGATTGLTIGHVRDVIGVAEDPRTHERQENVLIMQYEGGNCGGGMSTASGGDSGSAVLNEDRMVVGILHGTEDILEVNALVGHIHPIMDRLGVTVRNTGPAPVPAMGGVLFAETRGVVRPLSPSREEAAALRERILFSRGGKDLYRLVHQHRAEVLHLVNHCRAVTVAWHRNYGPDFLGHAAEAARDTRHRVPAELRGVDLNVALERVLDVLGRHGSTELKHDIDGQREELQELAREARDIESLADLLVPERKTKAG